MEMSLSRLVPHNTMMFQTAYMGQTTKKQSEMLFVRGMYEVCIIQSGLISGQVILWFSFHLSQLRELHRLI